MLHHSALSAQYLPLLLSLSPSLSFSIPFFSSLFAQCLTSNKAARNGDSITRGAFFFSSPKKKKLLRFGGSS